MGQALATHILDASANFVSGQTAIGRASLIFSSIIDFL
jgi:hypothetical protein